MEPALSSWTVDSLTCDTETRRSSFSRTRSTWMPLNPLCKDSPVIPASARSFSRPLPLRNAALVALIPLPSTSMFDASVLLSVGFSILVGMTNSNEFSPNPSSAKTVLIPTIGTVNR